MSVWDTYQSRITTHGETKRGSALKREIRYINNKLPDNLSYQEVTIYDQAHGYNIDTEEMAAGAVTQNVAIINSDNLNEKYIYSLPGEDIEHGSLVHWMDNYWLVTERDANTTLYTRAKLLQCNFLLRWVTDEHEICEQWCVIEDGTKLEHTKVCDGLVYRKRYAKRIPLIAGTPLELFGYSIRMKYAEVRTRENEKIGQSAAKLRTGEGSTTIPDVGVGASAPKWGTLNSLCCMVKI